MPDLNSLFTSKLALGVLIGSLVATGGTAMAAYAGALPDPLQRSAHVLIGAPEPGIEPADDALTDDELNGGTDADGTDTDGGATGPDVTGSAAFGLCTAYTNGGLSENSTAYKAFDEVEGGIDAYCDSVIREKSDKSEKSDRGTKPEKPAKSEKVTGPRGADDEGAEDQADDDSAEDQGTEGEGLDDGSDNGSEAPADAPADGSGDAPAEAPVTTSPETAPEQSTGVAPDQQKIAPDAEKPAKELPATSNGNGGGKDR